MRLLTTTLKTGLGLLALASTSSTIAVGKTAASELDPYSVWRFPDMSEFGRGELNPLPKFLIAYTTADAEEAITQILKTGVKAEFIQTYEALFENYGYKASMNELNKTMKHAGYIQTGKLAAGLGTQLTYKNPMTSERYMIIYRPKKIDYLLILIKIKR